jgi:membrane fusion protein (multidrug efflux system)
MEEIKTSPPSNQKRKTIALSILAIVVIAGGISGYLYIQYKKTHITTDDAYIEGRIHTISSKVPGTVRNIYVNDNRFVKKGDLLVEIDSQDFDIKVKEVSSGLDAERTRLSELRYRLDTAKQQFEEIRASVETAKANLELQEANLRQAEADMKRAEDLLKEDIIPKERFEKTKTGYDVSLAQIKAAKENLKQAEARLITQSALIKQTEASLEPQKALIKQREALLGAAELILSYTKIPAPSDGYITRKSVETGNQVQPGQPLLAVVPLEDIWVIANYKETQIERIRPGQKVKIKVDTYPGRTFNGRVESIMAGTGSVFSLFPPENATGSFVKVVQRVPVKIIFEKDTDPKHILRVGMSVVPTILIEK